MDGMDEGPFPRELERPPDSFANQDKGRRLGRRRKMPSACGHHLERVPFECGDNSFVDGEVDGEGRVGSQKKSRDACALALLAPGQAGESHDVRHA